MRKICPFVLYIFCYACCLRVLWVVKGCNPLDIPVITCQSHHKYKGVYFSLFTPETWLLLFHKTVTLGNKQGFIFSVNLICQMGSLRLFFSSHSCTHSHMKIHCRLDTGSALQLLPYFSNTALILHHQSCTSCPCSSMQPVLHFACAYACVRTCVCRDVSAHECCSVCGEGDSRGEPSWSCWNFLQILLVLKL